MFTTTPTSSEPQPFQASEHPDLQGKHVLIIDDHATTRQILSRYTTQWGMETHTVSTTETALAWVQQQSMPCDVVLINLHQTAKAMARLAGHIRATCHTEHIPVLALLSLTMRRELNGSDTDITAFLVKPIRPAPLHAALVSIMRGEPIAQRLPFDQPSLLDQAIGQHHPLHILLAEDNIINQKVALQLLAKLGYRADVAATGYEVLEALHRRAYDVILMDVQMPQMDGLETTSRIRTTWPAAQQPRIIAMTAHAMAEDRQRCLDAGMDDYVGKPVRLEELATKLIQGSGRMENGECRMPNAAQGSGRMENAECRMQNAAQGSGVWGQGSGVRGQGIDADLAVFSPALSPSPQTPLPSRERGFGRPPSPLLGEGDEATVDKETSQPQTPAPRPQPPDPSPQTPELPLDAATHSHFLDMMGDMAQELIAIFLKDTPDKLATMQQAIADNDPNALFRVAHTLKSSSGSIGALHFSALCKHLEQQGRSGNMDGAEEIVAQMEGEFARLQDAL
jgi:CheY-like chemotaxis protein